MIEDEAGGHYEECEAPRHPCTCTVIANSESWWEEPPDMAAREAGEWPAPYDASAFLPG